MHVIKLSKSDFISWLEHCHSQSQAWSWKEIFFLCFPNYVTIHDWIWNQEKKECKISKSCDPDCRHAFKFGFIHVHPWCLKLLWQRCLSKCSLEYNLLMWQTCKIWQILIPYFTMKARCAEAVDMLWKTFPVATNFQYIASLYYALQS